MVIGGVAGGRSSRAAYDRVLAPWPGHRRRAAEDPGAVPMRGSGRTARRERPGAGASTADGPGPGGPTRLTSPRDGADAEDIGLAVLAGSRYGT